MRWSTIAVAVLAVILLTAVSGPAAGQGPAAKGFSVGISPGEVTATPEMWFYEQYLRQYQDPKIAVRKQAEFRAAQRQRRLAALRWFGFSNMRPMAQTDPYHSDFSPHWSSNNSHYPFQWGGTHAAIVVVRSADRAPQ